MEAKYTVMTHKQRVESSHNPVNELREKDMCEKQAEISFKAGQANGISLEMQGEAYCQGVMAGIREVVGFLDKPCPHTGGIEEQQMRAMDCPVCWQAQLKDWGIE